MSKSDGSTADYYELPKGATELQDLISYRNLNAQDGEIFRAIYRKGRASHSDELRDARKVLFYAKAEVERLERLAEDRDAAMEVDSLQVNKMTIGTAGERMRDVFTPERKKEIVEVLTDNYMKGEELLASGKVRKSPHDSVRFNCGICGASGDTPLQVFHQRGCPNDA